jgi:hypothetical protein
MSLFEIVKELIPVRVVVFVILAIPIVIHIYLTYKEQERKAQPKPGYRKD